MNETKHSIDDAKILIQLKNNVESSTRTQFLNNLLMIDSKIMAQPQLRQKTIRKNIGGVVFFFDLIGVW